MPKNSHYKQGKIQAISAIREALGDDGFVSYCRGNILKYIWRAPHKGGTEDLYKALDYLTWMIEAVENKDLSLDDN